MNKIPTVNLFPGIFLRSPFNFLQSIAAEKGDFVRIRLGPTSVYLTSNPEHFQYILRDNHQSFKKSQVLYKAGKLVVGNGLATSEGEFWLRQRRMIQPHFHRSRIAEFTSTMISVIDDLLSEWLPNSQSSNVIDLRERMSELTIEITSRIMFGNSGITSEQLKVINKDQLFIVDYVALRGYLPFLPAWFPLPGTRRFNRVMKRLSETINHIIELGRESKADSGNLLSMLIRAVDTETNESMTNQQLFDEIMMIFIAGFETTSTALTWLFYLLQQHPKVKERTIAEIQEVVGTETPTLEDVQRLNYLRMVIQETMRYYPPVAMLPRTAVTDVNLGEHNLSAGTIVLLYFYGLHHNPTEWKNPERFDPERFSTDGLQARSRFAYLPFSIGPRQCIGNEFAMLESMLIVTRILQRYYINLDSDKTVTPHLSTTLIPKQTLLATVSHALHEDK